MSRGDETIDRAAERLQTAAESAAAHGGLRAKLAAELADDAAFLRKLKPSLIQARLRGEAPTDGRPGEGVAAPGGPQLGRRPRRRGSGASPYLVLGAALVTGIVIAKLIDWRGHAHPR